MAWRLAVVLLLAAHGALGAEPAPPVARRPDAAPAIPSSAELEARGAVIGEVHIAVGDVFDTSIEGEDGWLYRTANKLHINTREQVVRDQLLFKPGEPYDDRVVRETERLLRANDYMYDAVIVPVAYDGERVDLEVRTRDVWTLNPGISFSRKGGENTLGAQLQEDNLLGTGRSLDFEWDDNVDRTSLRGELPRSALPAQLHPLWRGLRARRRRQHQVVAARPAVLRARRAARGRPVPVRQRAQRPALRARQERGRVRSPRGVLRGLRRPVARPRGALGEALDGRVHLRARPLRSSIRSSRRPARCRRTARSPIRGSASTSSRTATRSASTRTRSAAPRTCWWACALRRGSATRPRRSAPIAMRS